MICLDSKKTIEIILDMIPPLKEKWSKNIEEVFTPLYVTNRHINFEEKIHNIDFLDTEEKDYRNLNILFSHFSTMKYEMEGIEMPLYASKYFPNSNVDFCYFDSRKRVNPTSGIYILNASSGKITSPIDNFRSKYDLVITRSNMIKRMRSETPELYSNSRVKINIQDNNYSPNFNLGEDYRFSYKEFFAPAGRQFSDRALANVSNFSKRSNIVLMTGSLVWWKGQAHWLNQVDPSLLRDYTVVVLGSISERDYFEALINVAKSKNINLLYSGHVQSDFLCDLMSYSKISVMNHYVDPPLQPIIGPSRTFGESIASGLNCLVGQTVDPGLEIGKTTFVPKEWQNLSVQFNQRSQDSINATLDKVIKKDNLIDKNSISMEEKCDSIFKKCLSFL